jgi:chemotaxis protein methyltransferase CheR
VSVNVDESYVRSTLSPGEFTWICEFIYARTGIVLKDGKQTLVVGRLGRRLALFGANSYTEYFEQLSDPNGAETRVAVDLLTTNETYFFREAEHFDFLREELSGHHSGGDPVRVWSAASSSGEEAYSLAMTLADCLPRTPWEVLGTDISSRVVEKAKLGLYPIDAAGKIPVKLLKRYCLKGKGDLEGYLAIDRSLTANVRFTQLNLIEPMPLLGKFDYIFLRNVMIYFDADTKQTLVSRLIPMMKPGGCFIVSHSETLNGIQQGLKLVRPSVYRSVG